MYLNTLFGQETIEQKSKGTHSAETDRAALPSPCSLARRVALEVVLGSLAPAQLVPPIWVKDDAA
jgi:hypothetical protein|tara:strand:- start:118 stop:312 length:195 start_codon:yes stop_codon:yes gene_type:complete